MAHPLSISEKWIVIAVSIVLLDIAFEDGLLRRLDVDRQGFGMLDNDLIAFFDLIKFLDVLIDFPGHRLLLRSAQSHRAIFVIDILGARRHFSGIDGDSTGLLSWSGNLNRASSLGEWRLIRLAHVNRRCTIIFHRDVRPV